MMETSRMYLLLFTVFVVVLTVINVCRDLDAWRISKEKLRAATDMRPELVVATRLANIIVEEDYSTLEESDKTTMWNQLVDDILEDFDRVDFVSELKKREQEAGRS